VGSVVVRRKKKSRYMRGIRTHGYGNVGQHRKSGSRGGKGAVGMHKHKWSWVLKYFPDWYGKHGFTYPPEMRVEYREINVGELRELIEFLMQQGRLEMEGDAYVIDLQALGYNKLLGRGSIDLKVKVRVYDASETAIEKIRRAGGEVVILKEATPRS
jgi:large subunit ribosomal protein L15